MKWKGKRQSENIEDARERSSKDGTKFMQKNPDMEFSMMTNKSDLPHITAVPGWKDTTKKKSQSEKGMILKHLKDSVFPSEFQYTQKPKKVKTKKVSPDGTIKN